MERRPTRPTPVLDTAGSTVSVPAGTTGQLLVNGIIWPLLAGRTLRIMNLSCNGAGDDLVSMIIQNLDLQLNFFSDPEGNKFIGALVLGTMNRVNPIGGSFTGCSVASDGDPIFELPSEVMITGVSNNAKSIQFSASCEARNQDAVNAHVLSVNLYVFIDFYARL